MWTWATSIDSVGVYVAAIVIAIALSVLLTQVGYRYRDRPGGEWFTTTMGLSALWSTAALVLVATDSDSLLVVAEIVRHGCAVTVPVAWFAFVVSYSGYDRLLDHRTVLLLFAGPAAAVLSMVAWPYTDLYFTAIRRTTLLGGVTSLETPEGPLAWVLAVYLFGLMAIGLGLIGRLWFNGEQRFSGQASWLFLGTIPPLVTTALEPLGVVGRAQLPYPPLGFALMGLAYGYALFHYRAFDLSPGTWRIGSDRAFEAMSESVVVLDGDGDVLGCNQSACDRFGWQTPEAAFGRNVRSLEPALAGARRRDRPTVFDHGGSRLEVSVSSVSDSRGRTIGEALVIRDVTERYERRQQLQVLNRVLRHNVRNSMTVVRGRAEALITQYDDDHARTIVAETDDLTRIAEKARTVATRLEETELVPEDVELRAFLERIVEDRNAEVGPVDVSLEVPSTVHVRTDRTLLEIALSNLLENAVVHGCPESDSPTDSMTSPVRVRVEPLEDGVAIEVADDGPGIPDAELAAIRDGTETPLKHGTGLGLWITTWAASRLDAELRFSTEGGTTVRLVVPDR